VSTFGRDESQRHQLSPKASDPATSKELTKLTGSVVGERASEP
jgi:hypothetical protein